MKIVNGSWSGVMGRLLSKANSKGTLLTHSFLFSTPPPSENIKKPSSCLI